VRSRLGKGEVKVSQGVVKVRSRLGKGEVKVG
jgi:hypothetical protein